MLHVNDAHALLTFLNSEEGGRVWEEWKQMRPELVVRGKSEDTFKLEAAQVAGYEHAMTMLLALAHERPTPTNEPGYLANEDDPGQRSL